MDARSECASVIARHTLGVGAADTSLMQCATRPAMQSVMECARSLVLISTIVATFGMSATSTGETRAAHTWTGIQFEGEPRLVARLLVHPDDIGSDRVRMGVLFELDPEWHIYGRISGETGLPTKLRWRIDGGEVDEIDWPPPSTFRDDDLETFGYEGRVLLSTVARRTGTEVMENARVDVELLACRTQCIPAEFTLMRSFDDRRGAIFARAAFAETAPTAATNPTDVAPPASSAAMGVFGAILFALLGGLVLNAMPCVLPVLLIKLVSLSELAHRSRHEMLRHTGAYTTGALSMMLLLAAAVAILRAAGISVGWGFQLQDPRFVAALCTLLVVLAANLFGAFEIRFGFGAVANVGMSAVGARRSFFDGFLVVLLATPCSAPFLGTAVGFAFANSTPIIFAVFSAIALGLTAPYWLVAAFPGFARRIPRAGPWMIHLRTALGFGLLATVVWLLAVLSASIAQHAVFLFLGLLVAIAALCWIAGVAQMKGRQRVVGVVTGALFALASTGLYLADGDVQRPPDEVVPSDDARFDPNAVRAALERGRPVFVYFTADWCISCKVNERFVLSQPRVRDTLGRLNFATFRADWTTRDEEIRTELARHGKAGVPFYLVYRPEEPDAPRMLPELLTVGTVLDALREAAPVVALAN